MSCQVCNKLTEYGAHFCNKCYSDLFCATCDYHVDQVGPLRSRRGNKCCEDCLNKVVTLEQLKEENIEMETISIIAENPTYLSDLLNGWWSDGDKYYFTIQREIFSAPDIPMDYDEFKRAIMFDTLDAERCGYIRGTTVIWS